jgi:AraC-like DNA-binding protein
MTSDIDALVRGAAIGIALLLGVAFWRARPNSRIGWIGSMHAIGVVGYLLWADPASLAWPVSLRLCLAITALSPPFLLWALTTLIFEDAARLHPAHWLWLALIEAAGVGQFMLIAHGGAPRWLLGLLGLGFRVTALALVAHALWIVWRGRPTDLVESRARLRMVVMLTFGVCAALILLLALLYLPSARRPALVQLGEAIVFLHVSAITASLVMQIDRDLLPAERRAVSAQQNLASSAQNAAALARLESLMKEQEIWREAGLTVADLAARVDIPEYRLRRLINHQLGFRNFTAFLNEYRLAAAADRLADRQQARTPILTIALDLGWGSIGPFNRAFRARFGVRPSDFRRART